MTTMNISLPAPMKEWVEAQARGGRHANASDYVRDLIRRDQERRDGLAELQWLITEDLESGAPEAFDLQSFLSGKRAHQAGRSG